MGEGLFQCVPPSQSAKSSNSPIHGLLDVRLRKSLRLAGSTEVLARCGSGSFLAECPTNQPGLGKTQ